MSSRKRVREECENNEQPGAQCDLCGQCESTHTKLIPYDLNEFIQRYSTLIEEMRQRHAPWHDLLVRKCKNLQRWLDEKKANETDNDRRLLRLCNSACACYCLRECGPEPRFDFLGESEFCTRCILQDAKCTAGGVAIWQFYQKLNDDGESSDSRQDCLPLLSCDEKREANVRHVAARKKQRVLEEEARKQREMKQQRDVVKYETMIDASIGKETRRFYYLLNHALLFKEEERARQLLQKHCSSSNFTYETFLKHCQKHPELHITYPSITNDVFVGETFHCSS